MPAKKKTEGKPMTPAEALAEATKRARVWATPVKQEKAAAESSKSDE